MMRKIYLLFLGLSLMACSQNPPSSISTIESKITKEPTPLSNCEWCGAKEAPENLSWKTNIAEMDEPGERIRIRGTIYLPDGKTPASEIIMYVYHTNKEGIYPKRGNEEGNAKRHGYLRSWLKTGKDGRYEFSSIKPEVYPSRTEPAHIHVTLMGEEFPEYWLESFLFEGDPLIKQNHRKLSDRTGGFSNIIQLEKDEEGILVGERDFILNRF